MLEALICSWQILTSDYWSSSILDPSNDWCLSIPDPLRTAYIESWRLLIKAGLVDSRMDSEMTYSQHTGPTVFPTIFKLVLRTTFQYFDSFIDFDVSFAVDHE